MPELRTDDGPRKLRAVWLGPKGATLPFEWTYVQWAVVLMSLPVGVGLLWALIAIVGLLTVGHSPWFALPFAIIYGAPLAVWLSVRFMRGVSFDEPVRAKVAVFRDEFGRQTREPAEQHAAWLMPFPRISEAAQGIHPAALSGPQSTERLEEAS